jgi:integrase
MTRQLNRLTARMVLTLKKPGRHADGGNLYLKITRLRSAALSKSFTFMYQFEGKQREAGLGSCGAITLAEARAKAAEYRAMIEKGVDPLAAKQAALVVTKALAERQTFGMCADAFFRSKRSGWSSQHASQWMQSIKDHCGLILDMPVDEVDTTAVLSVLTPIWNTIPETAPRIRGRIEAVRNYAKALKLCSGENPAAWRGHLALILPKPKKLSRKHFAAMAYSGVPAFVATLRENTATAALALELAVLTACRSNEVIGARWDEIDIPAKLWVIPPGRMKSGLLHRIPLSRRALAILEKQAAVRCNDFVFAGQRHGQPLGHAALRRLTPAGSTPHGFRSSFRDWCGNETSYPREVAEACLAHASGDQTEQAYRRGDALEKRRSLMEAWANYCEPGAGGNVVPMRA